MTKASSFFCFCFCFLLVIGCFLLLFCVCVCVCVCTDNCAVFAYSSVGFPFQIYINSLRPNNIPMDHRVRKILFAFVSILLNTKTQILLLLCYLIVSSPIFCCCSAWLSSSATILLPTRGSCAVRHGWNGFTRSTLRTTSQIFIPSFHAPRQIIPPTLHN